MLRSLKGDPTIREERNVPRRSSDRVSGARLIVRAPEAAYAVIEREPLVSILRGTRDPALVSIRGFAIVAMLATHVGGATLITAALHLGSWAVSPADLFVLTSGFVLGLKGRRDAATQSEGSFVRWCVRRALVLFCVHCVLTSVVLVAHALTGRLLAPDVAELGGFWRASLLVLTLREQPLDFMNILPLYVVFLAISPVALHAGRRGLSAVVVLASFSLWVFAQYNPNAVPLPDARLGPVVFSLAAWQFPFVIGLMTGFHSARAAELVRSAPALLKLLAVVGMSLLFLGMQLQRRYLHGLGLTLLPAGWNLLFSKATWGPLRAIYTVGFMHFSHLGIRRFLRAAVGSTLRPVKWLSAGLERLQQIGRRSLYCFQLHLLFALAASLLGTRLWSRGSQELVVAGAIGAFFALAKRNVGAAFFAN